MVTQLRYDPRLLEEVIQLELRRREEKGDHRLSQEYHRQADPLYHLSPERRESEFSLLHRRLFSDLGFEAQVDAVLKRYGRVLARVESLTFLRALQAVEEGADLGAPAPTERPAVVRLRTARFLFQDDLARFLDHELAHLLDLLDPEFAHDPDALSGVPPHRRRLVQERYRIAWATTVDGRLSRQGRRPLAERIERRREMVSCFPALSDPEVERLFETLWEDDRPTHGRLLAIAAVSGARDLRQPGAPCPLCGFPTHHWADLNDDALAEAIRLDVPHWRPDEGLCERCLEGYQARCATQIE